MNDLFEQFRSLVKDFISGKVRASEFEEGYLSAWREARDSGSLTALNAEANDAFDRIFTACDVYCSDPDLRGPLDFDDRQLLDEVKKIAQDMLC